MWKRIHSSFVRVEFEPRSTWNWCSVFCWCSYRKIYHQRRIKYGCSRWFSKEVILKLIVAIIEFFQILVSTKKTLNLNELWLKTFPDTFYEKLTSPIFSLVSHLKTPPFYLLIEYIFRWFEQMFWFEYDFCSTSMCPRWSNQFSNQRMLSCRTWFSSQSTCHCIKSLECKKQLIFIFSLIDKKSFIQSNVAITCVDTIAYLYRLYYVKDPYPSPTRSRLDIVPRIVLHAAIKHPDLIVR